MADVKLFVLKKDDQYIEWDGKTMTDRPSRAGRFSRTICQRKYPAYEMFSFSEAYNQWYSKKIKAGGGKE
jgi:hypothetical protein